MGIGGIFLRRWVLLQLVNVGGTAGSWEIEDFESAGAD